MLRKKIHPREEIEWCEWTQSSLVTSLLIICILSLKSSLIRFEYARMFLFLPLPGWLLYWEMFWKDILSARHMLLTGVAWRLNWANCVWGTFERGESCATLYMKVARTGRMLGIGWLRGSVCCKMGRGGGDWDYDASCTFLWLVFLCLFLFSG